MKAKQKSPSHLIESKSLKIIEEIIPDYWTIRNVYPDYGIDLSIEIFNKDDASNNYITSGEHIFIQAKGVAELKKTIIPTYDNGNICKKENGLKCKIKTSLLLTVHKMSIAVPVLLFLIGIKDSEMYFICLNDYIREVLEKQHSKYSEKESNTIYIPLRNYINKENAVDKISFFSKRQKLYSFFQKIKSQTRCITYLDSEELLKGILAKSYALELLNCDIWSLKKIWRYLAFIEDQLHNLIENEIVLINKKDFDKLDNKDKKWLIGNSFAEFTDQESNKIHMIHVFWEDQLNNLGELYETFCINWFLPTLLGEETTE